MCELSCEDRAVKIKEMVLEKCEDPMSVECSDKADRAYKKAMFKCLDCEGKADAKFETAL